MNKLLFLIGMSYLISSCNQTSSTSEGHDLVTTADLEQSRTSSKIDTTEIDVLTASPDKYKVVLENEHVRVIQYTLKPGEKDNPHTHPPKTSYVISGGTFRVYPENQEPFDYVEVQGTTEWSDRTSKHYVENIGNTTITILLTEIKSVN
jgi:quercetin dioxygenase-like cupin family protein